MSISFFESDVLCGAGDTACHQWTQLSRSAAARERGKLGVPSDRNAACAGASGRSRPSGPGARALQRNCVAGVPEKPSSRDAPKWRREGGSAAPVTAATDRQLLKPAAMKTRACARLAPPCGPDFFCFCAGPSRCPTRAGIGAQVPHASLLLQRSCTSWVAGSSTGEAVGGGCRDWCR